MFIISVSFTVATYRGTTLVVPETVALFINERHMRSGSHQSTETLIFSAIELGAVRTPILEPVPGMDPRDADVSSTLPIHQPPQMYSPPCVPSRKPIRDWFGTRTNSSRVILSLPST